jgi:DNA replication initiation complex subunit (GINS family)
MATLLNKRQVRELALTQAKQRAHKFTRVGNEFYVRCEANLREFIHNAIHRLPSVGKTIK